MAELRQGHWLSAVRAQLTDVMCRSMTELFILEIKWKIKARLGAIASV